MKSKLLTTCASIPLARAVPFFLVVPLFALLLKQVSIAAAFSVNLMIANMLCCCCFLLFRAFLLFRRFGAVPPAVPHRHTVTAHKGSPTSLRTYLRQTGYRLNAAGSYAEKGLRSVATMAALLSMVCLLLLGSYDNLFQFGGVVLVGTGDPSLLYDPAAYTMYSRGPLASISKIDFKLKCVNRIMPDSTYPHGAAELKLTDRDDRLLWQGTLAALGRPHTQDGYIFAMNSLEYNIGLIMLVNKNHLLYTDWLHLVPMAKPVPGFTHEGTLKRDKLNDVDGTALYNEVSERLKMRIRYRQEYIDVELGEAPNHERQVGVYKFINQGTARQSQIRVSRVRHTEIMLGLLAATLLATLVVLFSPRRRLWIKDQGDMAEVITDSGRSGEAVRSFVNRMGAGGDNT